MNIAGRSDQGQCRTRNEDAFYIPTPGGPQDMILVADGMGGHRGGDVASSTAVQVICQTVADYEQEPSAQAVVTIATGKANQAIYELAQQEEAFQGMGTTMTLGVLRDGVWTLGQVGDSRAYLFKKEGLVRITHDHSLVEEMVREGALTEQQAREHALRHIITRAVGIDPVLEVDFYTLSLAAGDRMLLCSDGLSDMVPEETLQDILRREESAQAAVEALIAEANRRGGRDNITAIVGEEGGANHG